MTNSRFISLINAKKGALRNQLSIPTNRNIPTLLLMKIIRTPTGNNIRNPTKTGKRIIKVTLLLKRRAVLANNFRNFPIRKR